MTLLLMVLIVLYPLVLDRDNEENVGSAVMLNWGAGLEAVLCFFYTNWRIDEDDLFFPWSMVVTGGIGWVVLILSIMAVLIRTMTVDAVNGRSFASDFGWLNDWKSAGRKSNQESGLKFEEIIQDG